MAKRIEDETTLQGFIAACEKEMWSPAISVGRCHMLNDWVSQARSGGSFFHCGSWVRLSA